MEEGARRVPIPPRPPLAGKKNPLLPCVCLDWWEGGNESASIVHEVSKMVKQQWDDVGPNVGLSAEVKKIFINNR